VKLQLTFDSDIHVSRERGPAHYVARVAAVSRLVVGRIRRELILGHGHLVIGVIYHVDLRVVLVPDELGGRVALPAGAHQLERLPSAHRLALHVALDVRRFGRVEDGELDRRSQGHVWGQGFVARFASVFGAVIFGRRRQFDLGRDGVPLGFVVSRHGDFRCMVLSFICTHRVRTSERTFKNLTR